MENMNLPTLTFRYEGRRWQVNSAGDSSLIIVDNPDLVSCVAYLVWNDVLLSSQVRMTPNPTPVTLQEIMSLARRIKDIFSIYDITAIDFDNFLKPEQIKKLLLVVSFEGAQHNKDVNDFSLIYKNDWGELFVRRFRSPEKLKEFIDENSEKFKHVEINYYIQRSSQYYEKIIERTKRIVSQTILGHYTLLL